MPKGYTLKADCAVPAGYSMAFLPLTLLVSANFPPPTLLSRSAD